MQVERGMGEWLLTNEVGRNSAVTEPAGGYSSGEVPSVGWKIALRYSDEIVVIAGVDDRVSEHDHGRN